MAGTITHLIIAKEILNRIKESIDNPDAFLLGNIAPDAIYSKINLTKEDKKRAHLRSDISDINWLEEAKMDVFNKRVRSFIEENIIKKDHHDLYLGYVVHLLTDAYNHKTIRQELIPIASDLGIKENDKGFYHLSMNEIDAMDAYFREKDQQIEEVINRLYEIAPNYEVVGYITKDELKRSTDWIKNVYLNHIQSKKPKYLSYERMDAFKIDCVNTIITQLSNDSLFPKIWEYK